MLYKVVQEELELRVPRELKEPQVSLKEQQEVVDPREHKVLRELLVLSLVPLLIQVELVHKAQLGLLVYLKGQQEERELKGLQAPQELQVEFRESKEHKDHKVLKVPKDQTQQLKDQQVLRVQQG